MPLGSGSRTVAPSLNFHQLLGRDHGVHILCVDTRLDLEVHMRFKLEAEATLKTETCLRTTDAMIETRYVARVEYTCGVRFISANFVVSVNAASQEMLSEFNDVDETCRKIKEKHPNLNVVKLNQDISKMTNTEEDARAALWYIVEKVNDMPIAEMLILANKIMNAAITAGEIYDEANKWGDILTGEGGQSTLDIQTVANAIREGIKIISKPKSKGNFFERIWGLLERKSGQS
jgi:hypothetical protein